MADRMTRTFYILGEFELDAIIAVNGVTEMDSRLKRLLFRAHHMGSNENDILFGGFATRYLEALTPEQVDKFESLIAEMDTD